MYVYTVSKTTSHLTTELATFSSLKKAFNWIEEHDSNIESMRVYDPKYISFYKWYYAKYNNRIDWITMLLHSNINTTKYGTASSTFYQIKRRLVQ